MTVTNIHTGSYTCAPVCRVSAHPTRGDTPGDHVMSLPQLMEIFGEKVRVPRGEKRKEICRRGLEEQLREGH